jgi:PEP-CTERM motif-containing protein
MSIPRIVASVLVASASIAPLGGSGIAQAEPITLTNGFTSFSAEAGTVSLLSNTLSLDLAALQAGTLTGVTQSGTFQVGASGGVNATFPFTLSRLVTLGDVSHVVSQTGLLSITPSVNTFLLNASPRTVFNLGSQGTVAFSFAGATQSTSATGTLPFSLGAQLSPTPEPSTLSLMGIVVAAWGTRRWKRRHLNTAV